MERKSDCVSSFWRNSRGISISKRSCYKAHYTIWIPDIFMILHLNDVLLQRSMDTLYFINCLFIITKVQCEEKKVWKTSAIIQAGFMPRCRSMRGEFQGIGIVLCLLLLSSVCLLQLLSLQWGGGCPRKGLMNWSWDKPWE